jgi:glycosyltransferase involved in cell wall biosynthesis
MKQKYGFSSTKAVEAARRRRRYVDCPQCGASSERYLFHRSGVRFVRCRACDLVYTNPVELEDGMAAPAVGLERLSIILPVYNEERYVRDVIEALLAKELAIQREIIVVESNSSDSSRAIVQSFENEPGVKIVLQDRPRGKGNAVRAGLELASGSIVLIQDADFEYDLDDYETLLDPILQQRADFVLGSRTLGLDDWRVRRYATTRWKGTLTNVAHVAFARTFNLLYRQRLSDINTMYKVFRRECVEGCHFDGNGFELDIELVCKISRNGFAPLEVPVNYRSRGYEEGKKITFRHALPSYFELFRNRVGRL